MKGIHQPCMIDACENPSLLAHDRHDNFTRAAAQQMRHARAEGAFKIALSRSHWGCLRYDLT
jgi:hypothetical protein